MNSKKASLSENIPLWSNQIQNAKMSKEKWNSIFKIIMENTDVKSLKMNIKFEKLLALFNKTITFADSLTEDNFKENFHILEDGLYYLQKYQNDTKFIISLSGNKDFGDKVKNFLSSKKKIETKKNDTIMLNNLIKSIFDILTKKILFLRTSMYDLEFNNKLFYV